MVDNKPVPWTEHADILNARRALRQSVVDHNYFTLEELQTSIGKLKACKAPGPDGILNELFMLLDDQNSLKLLEFYNSIWERGSVPNECKEAIVVSIYKGTGADTDPANYRPISRLNSIYKLFAAMLQSRLATQHESRIRATQYCFRPKRGTMHPLFILRRAMEWSEVTHTPLQFLFLDWKLAFDSIDYNSMMVALKRFGVSERAWKIISAIYTDPTFYTKGMEGTLEKRYRSLRH